ncbi:MAG: hypothetical protein NT118_09480 [Lentisphaerae bacterium]|nr:hypothetical protein [Lentisphaerota bacterium]
MLSVLERLAKLFAVDKPWVLKLSGVLLAAAIATNIWGFYVDSQLIGLSLRMMAVSTIFPIAVSLSTSINGTLWRLGIIPAAVALVASFGMYGALGISWEFWSWFVFGILPESLAFMGGVLLANIYRVILQAKSNGFVWKKAARNWAWWKALLFGRLVRWGMAGAASGSFIYAYLTYINTHWSDAFGSGLVGALVKTSFDQGLMNFFVIFPMLVAIVELIGQREPLRSVLLGKENYHGWRAIIKAFFINTYHRYSELLGFDLLYWSSVLAVSWSLNGLIGGANNAFTAMVIESLATLPMVFYWYVHLNKPYILEGKYHRTLKRALPAVSVAGEVMTSSFLPERTKGGAVDYVVALSSEALKAAPIRAGPTKTLSLWLVGIGGLALMAATTAMSLPPGVVPMFGWSLTSLSSWGMILLFIAVAVAAIAATLYHFVRIQRYRVSGFWIQRYSPEELKIRKLTHARMYDFRIGSDRGRQRTARQIVDIFQNTAKKSLRCLTSVKAPKMAEAEFMKQLQQEQKDRPVTFLAYLRGKYLRLIVAPRFVKVGNEIREMRHFGLEEGFALHGVLKNYIYGYFEGFRPREAAGQIVLMYLVGEKARAHLATFAELLVLGGISSQNPTELYLDRGTVNDVRILGDLIFHCKACGYNKQSFGKSI